MNAKAIILFSLCFFLIGFPLLWGQQQETNLAQQLDKVSLLIRLPSQMRKIEALKTSIAQDELSPTAKRKLEQLLATTIQEKDQQNKAIIATFTAHFDALPFLFVYDTTHHPRKTIFLNEHLEPAAKKINTDYLIQLRFGRPVVDNGNRPEAMVLTDDRLQDLYRPFPKPLTMTGIGYGFNKLLAPEMAFSRLLAKRVKKLDRLLSEMVQRQ